MRGLEIVLTKPAVPVSVTISDLRAQYCNLTACEYRDDVSVCMVLQRQYT
jgi:hypothetical protein